MARWAAGFALGFLLIVSPAQAQIPDDGCTSIPQPGGCPTPSPSLLPTVEPSPEPTPSGGASPDPIEAGVTPGAILPSPDVVVSSPDDTGTEEILEPLVVRRVASLPAELPRTGLDNVLLLALAADLMLAGLWFRRKSNRLSLEAFREDVGDVLG